LQDARADRAARLRAAPRKEGRMPIEKRRIWALVMNSTRARIVRSLGWRRGEDDENGPPAEIDRQIEAKQLRDVMADRPGRSFASVGSRRSAMEYGSDPLAEETRGLIREVIELLEKGQRKGAFRELALYAEPQVLGELRKMLPKTLQDSVVKEATANYANLAPQDLSAKLAADLKLGPAGR
jgi:protein required for attachment to host cells